MAHGVERDLHRRNSNDAEPSGIKRKIGPSPESPKRKICKTAVSDRRMDAKQIPEQERISRLSVSIGVASDGVSTLDFPTVAG
jgi:hypothetical protein